MATDRPPEAATMRFSNTLRIQIPEQIGEYRIVREIASGGMGTVFEAIQHHPRRTVALKLLQPYLNIDALQARFEREIELLGRLQHPGIAQIYTAGTTRIEGQELAYFAMEHVPSAVSITAFADREALPLPKRLMLFQQLCEAVHHGHQKGVLHRDLKPGNVLVDSSGHLKVIDFGIARAVGDEPELQKTKPGEIIGTLQYLSPEQLQLQPADLDFRSDVYALGLILYELLTGALPDRLRTADPGQLHQAIVEETFPAPSSVDPTIHRDLDAVAGKALSKNRTDRYAAASELAQDIGRFLTGAPVSARKLTFSYQVASVFRRHKVAASVLATGIAIALLSSVALSWALIQAREAQEAVEEAAREAATQAARLQRTNAFLKDMLKAPDPENRHGGARTVEDLLQQALSRLEHGAFDDVEEAELRAVIGATYRQIGRYDTAERELRLATQVLSQTLGPTAPETLIAESDLASAQNDAGDRQSAIARFERIIPAMEVEFGKVHMETLLARNNYAWLLYLEGAYASAAPLFLEAYDGFLLQDNADAMVARSLSNYGASLLAQGKAEQATSHIDAAANLALKSIGPAHQVTLYTQSNQAWLLETQAQFAEALQLYTSIVDRAEQVLGADHSATVFWRSQLGWQQKQIGLLDEAHRTISGVLSMQMETLGADHPNTIESARRLGEVEHARERWPDAIARFEWAERFAVPLFGSADPRTLLILLGKAWSLHEAGQHADAKRVALQVLIGYQALDDSLIRPEEANVRELLEEIDQATSARR